MTAVPRDKAASKKPRAPRRAPSFNGPGPLATAERAAKARTEARAILEAILPLNLPRAAELIRRRRPTPDAIALLPFLAHALLASADRSQRGTAAARARWLKDQPADRNLIREYVAEERRKDKRHAIRNATRRLNQAGIDVGERWVRVIEAETRK